MKRYMKDLTGKKIVVPKNPMAICLKVRAILLRSNNGNETVDLGEYSDEVDAAMAYDFARIFTGHPPSNFPSFDYKEVFDTLGLRGIPDY